MTAVYYSDCDQFDNSRTGFYATEQEAIDAFWAENTFSDSERDRVVVYTRSEEVTPSVIASAAYLAANGSPSPALAAELNKIEARISEVEAWAPNYFGDVPDDYNEVVENLDWPRVEAVTEQLAAEPEAGLDSAIAAAYSNLLPAGYEGVGVDVRVRN